jgi:hypothetical protein
MITIGLVLVPAAMYNILPQQGSANAASPEE